MKAVTTYRIITTLLLVVLVTYTTRADTPALSPGAELERVAIASYAITPTPYGAEVEFKDVNGTTSGNVTFNFERDESVSIEWRPLAAEPFAIAWNPGIGEFKLTLQSGDTFVRSFNFETREWVGDEASIHAIDQRMAEIGAIGSLLSKTMNSNRPGVGKRNPTADCITDCGPAPGSGPRTLDPSSDPVQSGSRLYCSNDWIEGTAYSLGFLSRAEICWRARNDANTKCSNQYCMGCCQLLDCDAYCVADDFFCAVGSVHGRYCIRQ